MLLKQMACPMFYTFNTILIYSLSCFLIFPLVSSPETLFSKLPRNSLTKYLLFYSLYPDSPEGSQVKNEINQLLQAKDNAPNIPSTQAISSLTRQLVMPFQKEELALDAELLNWIEYHGKRLGNRRCKGYKETDWSTVFEFNDSDIDLARFALLTYEKTDLKAIRHYEAYLDFLALEIQSALPFNASNKDKITAINHQLFDQLGYRFPPKAAWKKDVDTYSQLHSVIDQERGVCLGLSIIYLALAQRLNLDLEIITPPGHIYLRHKDGDSITNIETTSFGSHFPCEAYLSLTTSTLSARPLKDLAALILQNQSASYSSQQNYKKSEELLKKAIKHSSETQLLTLLLALNLQIQEKKEESLQLLSTLDKQVLSPYDNVLRLDLIELDLSPEALGTLMDHDNETTKKQKLVRYKSIANQYPLFRSIQLSLASVEQSLAHYQQSLEYLETFHKLYPNHPEIEFALVQLQMHQGDLPLAWVHMEQLAKLIENEPYIPKEVSLLYNRLWELSPKPSYNTLNTRHRKHKPKEGFLL